jgi:C-terminal processing protease CtpA/Prc
VDKPAYVLTSSATFSAAEAFSYDLRMLNRVTLVGETTSGRGHMGSPHQIDEHFTIRVPGIKVINPVSKTNWEGTGVAPDVRVNSADALQTAETLALTRLHKK